MSPADPTHGLANPYARNDGSGRSARVAGRALAVGALGLGAVAVFTGTGSAEEAPTAEDTTSEVTSDVVPTEAEEPAAEGLDAPVEDVEAEPLVAQEASEEPTAEGEALQFASGFDAHVDPEDLMFYSGVAQTPDVEAGQDGLEPLTGPATETVPQAPADERRPEPTGQQGEQTDPQVEQERIAQWKERVAQWEASGRPSRTGVPLVEPHGLGEVSELVPAPVVEPVRAPLEIDVEAGTTTDDASGEAPSGEPGGGGFLPPGPPSDPDWEFSNPVRHYDSSVGGWVFGPDPAAADTAEEEAPRERDALAEAAVGDEVPVEGAAPVMVPLAPSVEDRPDSTDRSAPSGPRLTQERLAQQQDRVAQRQDRAAQRQDRVAQRQERLAQRQDRVAQRQERLAQRQEGSPGRAGVLLADPLPAHPEPDLAAPDAVPDVSPALLATGFSGGDLVAVGAPGFPSFSGGDFGFSGGDLGSSGGDLGLDGGDLVAVGTPDFPSFSVGDLGFSMGDLGLDGGDPMAVGTPDFPSFSVGDFGFSGGDILGNL